MASAIKNATRLLKSYLKDVEGNTPSNEALKVRDALNYIDKSAYLLLEMIETCERGLCGRGKNAQGGIANATARFVRSSVMWFAYGVEGVNYSCTHDLDDLNYTRKSLNDLAQMICDFIWFHGFQYGTSYMDDLEVDAEQLETRWGDMDTLARYGFAA